MSPTTETVVERRPGVSFTPFKAEHAFAMRLTAQASESLRHVNLERTFAQYETGGPGWTLWADGTVVGCAGLMIPWPGMAHAWLLPSPALVQYPRTVIETVVATLRDLISQCGLRRVECEVQVGFRLGERLVEALGFVPEGPPKRRWGPNDEDYQGYVILQPRVA